MISPALFHVCLTHAWRVLGRVVWWFLVRSVALDELKGKQAQLVHATVQPTPLSSWLQTEKIQKS
jgi:hypothetical protein